ncbi:MAG: type I methionyl aminopeptidase [Opitutales bacterium]
MIPVKTDTELDAMRAACRTAANILKTLESKVVPGVTTYDLDQFSRELMDEAGAVSACYNYRSGSRVFPAYSCISVNEEIVHGIGSLKRILQDGDIITLDVNIVLDGFVGDNARTVPVGEGTDPTVLDLVNTTEQALDAGIRQARNGKRVGDISSAVQSLVERKGYTIVRDFVGHGVGRSMHEDPQIPNFGRPGTGPRLKAGMTLAIEPMVNLGGPEVDILDDGWTAVTRDRQPSCHFEHTVLVGPQGPEILTVADF